MSIRSNVTVQQFAYPYQQAQYSGYSQNSYEQFLSLRNLQSPYRGIEYLGFLQNPYEQISFLGNPQNIYQQPQFFIKPQSSYQLNLNQGVKNTPANNKGKEDNALSKKEKVVIGGVIAGTVLITLAVLLRKGNLAKGFLKFIGKKTQGASKPATPTNVTQGTPKPVNPTTNVTQGASKPVNPTTNVNQGGNTTATTSQTVKPKAENAFKKAGIKFNREKGKVLNADGTAFSGTIEQTNKNGKFVLEYKDGVLQTSEKYTTKGDLVTRKKYTQKNVKRRAKNGQTYYAVDNRMYIYNKDGKIIGGTARIESENSTMYVNNKFVLFKDSKGITKLRHAHGNNEYDLFDGIRTLSESQAASKLGCAGLASADSHLMTYYPLT